MLKFWFYKGQEKPSRKPTLFKIHSNIDFDLFLGTEGDVTPKWQALKSNLQASLFSSCRPSSYLGSVQLGRAKGTAQNTLSPWIKPPLRGRSLEENISQVTKATHCSARLPRALCAARAAPAQGAGNNSAPRPCLPLSCQVQGAGQQLQALFFICPSAFHQNIRLS